MRTQQVTDHKNSPEDHQGTKKITPLTLSQFDSNKTMLNWILLVSYLSVLTADRACVSLALPSFHWAPEDTKYDIDDVARANLLIDFHDGEDPDVAILWKHRPIPVPPPNGQHYHPCIYRGTLEKEGNVAVALTGCPGSDSFDIVFNSVRSNETVIEVRDGEARAGRSTQHAITKAVEIKDSEKWSLDWSRLKHKVSHPKSIPEHLTYKITLVNDESWVNYFGNESYSHVESVVNIAQVIFTWQSLTTNITLVVDDYQQISGIYRCEEDLDSVSEISGTLGTNSDSFVYLVYDDNTYGTVGIAFLGTVCVSRKKYRTALVEWINSDAQCAQIMAHEMGHNLNMKHDFDIFGMTRYDSNGEICTDINAIMDYNQPFYDKWSTCSVEDMNAYYENVVTATSSYCLA